MPGHSGRAALERAQLLVERRRYREAIEEISRALAAQPDDARAHALLGIALCGTGRRREALDAVHRAVALEPEEAFPHVARAHVLLSAGRARGAEAAAREALRLGPYLAQAHALLAAALCEQERYEEALQAALDGLAADPNEQGCLNLRAELLRLLGRTAEAHEAARVALGADPEDANAHGIAGWIALRSGDYVDAALRFREALRLEPDNEYARNGIVHALQARHRAYRPILALLLRGHGAPAQWLAVAVWVGLLLLIPFARETHWVRLTLFVAWLAVLVLVWIATPIFHTILRLDGFGRLVLTASQRHQSNALLASAAIGIALAVIAYAGDSRPLARGAAAAFVLILPITSTIGAGTRRARWIRGLSTSALAFFALAGVIFGLADSTAQEDAAIVAFVAGCAVYVMVVLSVTSGS